MDKKGGYVSPSSCLSVSLSLLLISLSPSLSLSCQVSWFSRSHTVSFCGDSIYSIYSIYSIAWSTAEGNWPDTASDLIWSVVGHVTIMSLYRTETRQKRIKRKTWRRDCLGRRVGVMIVYSTKITESRVLKKLPWCPVVFVFVFVFANWPFGNDAPNHFS